MTKQNKYIQLHLFNKPLDLPKPKTRRFIIPERTTPQQLFADLTYLGHGDKAAQTARAVEEYCVARGYEALIDYDEEVGWVFHALVTPHWSVFRKPISEHFATSERGLQRQITTRLRLQGYNPKMEVSCSTGRADIVTDDAVFEVKHLLTRDELSRAIRQVKRYRDAIDPCKRAIVIGKESTEDIDDLIRFAQSEGVEVAFWQEPQMKGKFQ